MYEIKESNYNYWDIHSLQKMELSELIAKAKICIQINPNWKLGLYNNISSFSYNQIGITSTIIAVYENKKSSEFCEKYYISETGEIYYNKENLSELDKFSLSAYNNLIKL